MTFDVVPARLFPQETRQTLSSGQSELVALVIELFTEGTLSFQQLRALASLPEFAAHLGETIAAASHLRKSEFCAG